MYILYEGKNQKRSAARRQAGHFPYPFNVPRSNFAPCSTGFRSMVCRFAKKETSKKIGAKK